MNINTDNLKSKLKAIDWPKLAAAVKSAPRWVQLYGVALVFVVIVVFAGVAQHHDESTKVSAKVAGAPGITASPSGTTPTPKYLWGAGNPVGERCPFIPPSASSSEMRADMEQCARAADKVSRAEAAQEASQSERAFAQMQAVASAAVSREQAQPASGTPTGATGPVIAAVAPATTVAPAMGAGGPLTLILPAQTPPAGLTAGRAAYTLDSAPFADASGSTPGAWTRVGAATVQASTSAFGSRPDKGLDAVTPGSGFLRESWTYWLQLQHDGQHVVAIRSDAGYDSTAAVVIDDQPKPVVQVAGAGTEQTALGSVDLAAGWHRLTLVLVRRAGDARPEVDLFVRGPAASAPVSFVPFAPAPVASGTTSTQRGHK